MHIKFEHKDLKEKLTLLNTFIPKSAKDPMQQQLKLVALPQEIVSMEATNGIESLKVYLKAEKSKIQGSCTVPAKSFLELVKNFDKDKPVTLKLEADLMLKVSQARARYTLRSMDPFSFPGMREYKQSEFTELNPDALRLILTKVSPASSSDEYRAVLNSVLLEPANDEGFMKAVASDGIRLLTCRAPGVLNNRILIPKTSAQLLSKTLDGAETCGVISEDSAISFHINDYAIFKTRLLNKDFPDYKRLISKSGGLHINFLKSDMTQALKRALLFVENNSDRVLFYITKEGLINIRCQNSTGEAIEEVSYTCNNPSDINMGFNGKMLLQVIEQFDDEEVRMVVYGAEAPAVFTGKPHMLGLVQPMKL